MDLNKFFASMIIILHLSASGQLNWKLVKREKNIDIYVRDVPNSKLKELKISVLFNSTLDAIYTLLSDINAQPKFQFGCLNSNRLGERNHNEQYFYQELYMPWPFTNRDGIFKQTIIIDPNHYKINVETDAIPSYKQIVDGFIRVPFMHSTWLLEKINEQTVRGQYNLSVDPGGSIPLWLVNLFITKGPYESLMHMQTLLNDPSYKFSTVKELHK